MDLNGVEPLYPSQETPHLLLVKFFETDLTLLTYHTGLSTLRDTCTPLVRNPRGSRVRDQTDSLITRRRRP